MLKCFLQHYRSGVSLRSAIRIFHFTPHYGVFPKHQQDHQLLKTQTQFSGTANPANHLQSHLDLLVSFYL